MDQAQFQTIRRIFEDALLKDAALREQFLIEACGGNEDLQREVNCLLVAHEAADSGQGRVLQDTAQCTLPVWQRQEVQGVPRRDPLNG